MFTLTTETIWFTDLCAALGLFVPAFRIGRHLEGENHINAGLRVSSFLLSLDTGPTDLYFLESFLNCLAVFKKYILS